MKKSSNSRLSSQTEKSISKTSFNAFLLRKKSGSQKKIETRLFFINAISLKTFTYFDD